MTVSSITPVNNYTGNSSAKTFDFDFLIESQEELQVVHTNSNGVLTTLEFGVDYSINEIGNKNGSYITFPLEGSNFEVLSNEEIISLSLTLPIKQESEFENSANLNLNILERTFDYIVRILQIMNRKIERSIKTQEGSSITPDEIIEDLQKSAQNSKLYAEISSQKSQEAQNSANEALQSETGAQNVKEEILELSETVKADILTGINNYKALGMYLQNGVLYYKKETGEVVPYVVGTQMPVGCLVQLACGSDYVPDGCLPCDGTEYSKTQFPSLWGNFLTAKTYSLNTEIEYSDGTIQTDGTLITSMLTVKGDSISDEVVFCLKLPENVQTKKYITGTSGSYIENGKIYDNNGNFLINVFANGNLYIKSTISENTTSSPQTYKISYYYSNNNSTFTKDSTLNAFPNSIEFYIYKPNFPIVLTKSYLNSTLIAIPKILLNTCTYDEYATELETYGQCAKFAVDSENEKFKVPLLPNKTLTDINDEVGVKGNGITFGLTDGTVNYGLCRAGSDIGTTMRADIFNSAVGTKSTTTSGNGSALLSFGVSENTATSGIIADAKNAKIYQPIRYFVVVANGQINESMMDWSAWASGLQSKLNKDHSNDEKPYVTEMYENGSSGYVLYSNGYCEQWGKAERSAASDTVTLLKPYKNVDYNLQISPYHTTLSLDGRPPLIYETSKIADSFVFNLYTSYSGVYWKTSGYIS